MNLNDFIDNDEEIVEFMEWERRPHIVQNRINHFDKWDELDFFRRFHLKKQTVLIILEQIENIIETPTDRNLAIRPIDKLLLTLRFYALGTMLIATGDFAGVSKSSACNIVRHVSIAIAQLAPQYIKMSSNADEISNARIKFYNRARVPRIIGAIDCTHVRIQSPSGINAELFRNRKGYFSLNVQTVSSADLKILDIVARWPRSVHDQTIFNNSRVKERLENNEFGNSLLVGDSGYTNTMFVITPLLNTHNDIEELYNEAIIRTRNPVERQYGVWKRRFPILALGLRLKLQTSMAIVVATAILHNIAYERNEELPSQDADLCIDQHILNEDWDAQPLQPDDRHINARAQLIADYFPNLL
ncbi:putative nuclease HARBI1 [Odontomachus brunneus]|uniref:putative nuclease HARBI1 n=1 Tax=Odontomachus brunneus TaxID=486640 RepID=UPI0013F26CD9|nr:putative nuclease HARBI1 [Odontomachus brunneus]XP_032690385.1 putative nuclease HARBI1 [Odontomachus brunneus]XP_032690386.1 putative nuclease HARBI1 [Odontomachus brunneus]XP_032690387.1 putative nuclease HARBI1 [Odontomachus brunneus]XP_032690388.1 putative nuclease HARBI1 [Odontomachus brunneus]XP_032690389.1 putative nuclease HARBI1 [Odontomachus brunneus]XP_032690390.1 putative nuclease HARBI1 [Odontomachus brunneus]XP_032690391.1 putative nuclease HARBI1 [Odontomachus brunneus]